MKDVLLINMATSTDPKGELAEYNPALGVLSIATMLELHGHECIVKDYRYEPMDMDELCDLIQKEQIKIVTMTVYTINVDEALRFAKYLKKTIKGLTIIFGGPHATLDSEYCYTSRYVDYVMKGEGEASVPELIEAIQSDFKVIQPKDIPGVCYCDKRGIVENKVCESITNLDLFPIIRREIVDIDRYVDTINISSSRGCPAKCVYCAGSVLGGKRYRIREIEHVILEIILIKSELKDKIRLIYFIDDTFTAFKKRVFRFLKLREILHIEYFWRCESRLDVMDKELIDAISDNGCKAIHFGVESGSQYVLDHIMKRIKLDKAVEIIKYAASKKMLVCCYFMLAHYCDTLETMEETCALIRELVDNCHIDATLHYNTPFPGTFQYENRDALGIKMTSEEFKDFVGYRPLIETDNFTIEDQKRIGSSMKRYLNRSEFHV